MRGAEPGLPLDAAPRQGPDDTSAALGAHRTAGLTRPGVAARGEMRTRLAESLGAMARWDPMDREVLAMHHFEPLSNGEASRVLVPI